MTPDDTRADAATDQPDPYRVFRPLRARRVAWFVGVFSVVVLSVVGLTLPGQYAWYDRAGFVLSGLLIAWFCYRQAAVRAVADADGLTVRNLFLTRRLSWPQVVSVRFGRDRTWAQLDLGDGDTLAVMAIQRADGERADAEARRLATLVAHHTRTDRDD